MGTYYMVGNFTKRQYFDPDKLGDPIKMPSLMFCSPGGTGSALVMLMGGAWRGDKVELVSDDYSYPWKDDEDNWKDITGELKAKMSELLGVVYWHDGVSYRKREKMSGLEIDNRISYLESLREHAEPIDLQEWRLWESDYQRTHLHPWLRSKQKVRCPECNEVMDRTGGTLLCAPGKTVFRCPKCEKEK